MPERPSKADPDAFQTWIDKQIRTVIGDGNVAHLPGAGQPLDLSEDESIPDDWRLAYKVMRDNDVLPEWLQLKQELDALLLQLIRMVAQFKEDYQRRLHEAQQRASLVLEREAEQRWQAALQRLNEQLSDYNKRVLTYNLIVPPAIGQREPLSLAGLLG